MFSRRPRASKLTRRAALLAMGALLVTAGIFIAGVESAPRFSVPFRLLPIPALLAFVIALAITMSGSIWSSWRAAIVSPDEAMR